MEEESGIMAKSNFFISFVKELAKQERVRTESNNVGSIGLEEVWCMPTTWVMKMLYFTLLKITENEKYKMDFSFKICGNFEAWRYGPVEVDAYRMIKNPFYEYSVYARWDNNGGYCEIIHDALNYLYKDTNFSKLIGCTDSLVSLSHDLKIWRDAKQRCSSKMILDEDNVKEEYEKFIKELKNNVGKYIFTKSDEC